MSNDEFDSGSIIDNESVDPSIQEKYDSDPNVETMSDQLCYKCGDLLTEDDVNTGHEDCKSCRSEN